MTGTDRGQALTITIAVALVIALMLGVASYEQVGEGHVGVERVFGDVTGATYDPGPHFVAPWVGVQNVEVRPRTYTMSDTEGEGEQAQRQDAIQVQSADGTTHRVDVTIRYRVDAAEADVFVTQWRQIPQLETRLIRPTVRDEVRAEAAAISQDLIWKKEGRERLSTAAHDALEREFAEEAIVLEAVQIRDVSVPPQLRDEYNKREVAQAEAIRKQHEIEVAKLEAERKREVARGNADVIAIEGQAIRENPQILTLRYIEAIKPTDKVIVAGGGAGQSPIILDATGTRGVTASNGQSMTTPTNATAVLGEG